ncbi:MAG: hypothetical protein ABH878_09230, partial [bacterium]
QAKYQRKSISYVDYVWLAGGGERISRLEQNLLLDAIRREIEMPRFDFNALPEPILRNFNRDLTSRSISDLDGLAAAISDALVPEILQILDYEKEMRAAGLVGETDRASFVVEKAKELGITAEDLEAIMNSAYIYMPVLSSVSVDKNEEKDHVSVTLVGGIIWFSVKADSNGGVVELLARKISRGIGFASLKKRYDHNGAKLDGVQYAFASAARTLALNLRVASQEIPDFQLTNPLTATGAGWVRFSMGRQEGVGMDDKFVIAEYYEQPDGSVKQRKLGLVRAAQVNQSDCRARSVIGRGYERGMLAVEHPRLPIDVSLRFFTTEFKVDSGAYNNEFVISEESVGSLYTGQLWLNYNTAEVTNLSQFFLSLYGEIGYGEIHHATAFDAKIPGGLYLGGGIGLVKKYYLNRFHLGLEALGSLAYYTLSGTKETDATEWKWQLASMGLTCNANLEIALGYDFNLGAGVSYRLFAPQADWKYTDDGEEKDLSDIQGLPEVNFSGWGYQIYFTWSLPALSIDPVGAVRGTAGL